MTPIVIDEFLDDFARLKEYASSCDFVDEKNPHDGVVYPAICKDIPGWVLEQIKEKLKGIFNRDIVDPVIFMRRSEKGVSCPHIAHTDKIMGDYSLMLYFNDAEGGTAFLRHNDTGVMYHPEDNVMRQNLSKHLNDVSKWTIMGGVNMKKNRAAIFDAGYFHCAMPVGGFGEGDNARCVLTCFFS